MDKFIDINKDLEVMTFKSGKFVFSARFNEKELSPLITESRILRGFINELPILPWLAASSFEEDIIRRSIFGTAAIEGNPLNEDEVGRILSQRGDRAELSEKAEREIGNLKEAYAILDDIQSPEKPLPLSEKLIKDVHEGITHGIEHKFNMPGHYRNNKVQVGDADHGGVDTPPKILKDIQKLMTEFIKWINGGERLESNPVIRAGLTHFYLGKIHPFADGNGRVARIMEAIVLHSAGFRFAPKMLSNYYYRNKDDYFIAFSETIRNKENDLTPFLKFYLQGLVESENGIKESILFFIRKFSLRDFYRYQRQIKDISQRQHDLLMMMLDGSNTVTLFDLRNSSPFNTLYRNVSEKTASRDLDRLTKKGFLEKREKQYSLNFRVLG